MDVFRAFEAAYAETSIFIKRQRDRDRLQERLKAFAHIVPEITSPRVLKAMAEIQAQLSTHRSIIYGATKALESLHRFDRPIRILLARRDCIDSAVRMVEANQRQWKMAFSKHRQLAQKISVLAPRTHMLNQAFSQVQSIRAITHPFKGLREQISELTQNLRIRTGSFATLLSPSMEALAQSDRFVARANTFFAGYTPIRSIYVQATSIELEHSELVDSAEDTVECADTSEQLLHQHLTDDIQVVRDMVILIHDKVHQLEGDFKQFKPLLERAKTLVTPGGFLRFLKGFATIFSRESWLQLWDDPGNSFRSKPESIARMALSLYCQGACGGFAAIASEIRSGEGFVDLWVNFLGYEYLLEIKIVGSGWSIGSAKGGLNQLNEYMAHFEKPEAYLLVFDGRKTLDGEQLDARYRLKNGVVDAVSVRSYHESPTKRGKRAH